MKSERKKCSNSRRHPGYYRRELQGDDYQMIKEALSLVQEGAMSPSSKWRIVIWCS
jgi:hypothetical protein